VSVYGCDEDGEEKQSCHTGPVIVKYNIVNTELSYRACYSQIQHSQHKAVIPGLL
jgi:hypothetical protein